VIGEVGDILRRGSNEARFPNDFLFQLTEAEKLKVVTNCDHLKRLKYSPANRVFVSGNYAYVAARTNGLQVFSLEYGQVDETTPTRQSELTLAVSLTNQPGWSVVAPK
jgi:hypothetical protein